MAPRRVGVLGGMGPEATVLLMQRVIAAVKAEDDAGHVPLIVDQNPQVPSRIRHLIEDVGPDPSQVLAEMAARLATAGAEALAMPCNTAHHYLPAIAAAAPDLPILDMVALSAARAAELSGGAPVGLLASPAVRRTGLFDAALARHGITALHVRDEDATLAAIRQIKARGPDEISRAALVAASQDLLERGARVQLVACTEFSLIAEAVAPAVQALDTLDVLTEAVVAFSLGTPPAP